MTVAPWTRSTHKETRLPKGKCCFSNISPDSREITSSEQSVPVMAQNANSRWPLQPSRPITPAPRVCQVSTPNLCIAESDSTKAQKSQTYAITGAHPHNMLMFSVVGKI